MGKLIKNIRGYIQPAVFYIPFTFYFFLFAVAAIVAGNWLSVREIIPESSFADIFKLFLKRVTVDKSYFFDIK